MNTSVLFRAGIATLGLALFATQSTLAATINGKVLGAGAPIADSTVTLFAASASNPQQLGQARTGADGDFSISSTAVPSGSILYLVAKGGRPTRSTTSSENPAIALLAVAGATTPAGMVINEFTTVASVWTTTSSSRARRSRASCCSSRSPLATCLASSIFPAAGGVRPSMIRSTAATRRQWRISRHSATFSPAAPRR